MRRFHLIAAAAVALCACDDSTGPSGTTQFGEPISPSQFTTEVGGTARIEIQFTALTGPIAREIEVEPDDAEEKIESRVTAIDQEAQTLTLELGGLVVSYDPTTRFRTLINSDIGGSTWEQLVRAEVDAGRRPSIEARRNQPATPQAPNVSTFLARDLRLVGAIDDAKIEVYVDADNLVQVASPPPVAILTVFGLPVQIVSTTQIRRIVNGAPQPGASVEFEGRLSSVNVSGRTLTLADGTVIQVSASTVFEADGDVLTLAAASAAVLSGNVVRVEGDGTVQSAGPPRTIAATNVKIEIDD